MLTELMQKKAVTKYQLAKNSGIPYTTVSDIVSGKAQLEKCTAETIYRLAKELDVSMETLLEPCFQKRANFELFKSNVCHRVKELGDIDFISEVLEKDDIRAYYNQHWYRESLYLLAMLDYLSRVNEVPLCSQYDDLRHCKLDTVIYPSSILAICAVSRNNHAKKQALMDSIPEFKRFNIIENEVRNVI